MDPSLLKQTEAFKRRALANPVVEKRTKKPEPESTSSGKSKPSKKSKNDEPKAPRGDFDYKSAGATTQAKFAALAKIVKHLRRKRQENDLEPMSLEEILDETNMPDLNVRIQYWLNTEALAGNPKVEVVDGDKYRFKPVLNIHDRKGLQRLLVQNDNQGLGGILLEEVQESVPNCQKVLKNLGSQVLTIERPSDKKQVLFYNNKELRIPVNEELQKLWRGATVDGVDERNIEEYLQRHNIAAMQDRILQKASKQKRKGGGKKWDFKKAKTHNDHVGEVLQDYSDMKK